MKLNYLLFFFSILPSFTFAQENYNEILKDIDAKKQQLSQHYSELVTIYQNKQLEITGEIDALETNHKLEIHKKEGNINELETEYTKYKKQVSLYNTLKTFYDNHNNYEMQLYENKADCKLIKKRYTKGFKKLKLLFAVFATAHNGVADNLQNRDLLYFWSDSSITVFNNSKNFLPDDILSNKIQSRPFLNYQVQTQYDGNRQVYRNVNWIINNLNYQMFVKLISYVDCKKPLEINEQIIGLKNEINASDVKFNEEKSTLIRTKETFSVDTLIKHRAADSLTLLTLENFYKLKIKEQSEIKKLVTINYSKYKTTNINGADVYNLPISISTFRNGDSIMIARTQSEWEKFLNSNIPAYKFKDFDENNVSYGLIYNYHAYVDLREIAPYGFHKLNLQDYNYLENQVVFKLTKLEKCWCSNGKENVYEWCSYCSHWTKDQRKYNICGYCNNIPLKITGKKICSSCNGTGSYKSISLKERKISIYPGYSENNGLWMDGYTSKVLDDGRLSKISHDWDDEESEFQIFICKDREIKKLNDNFNSIQIGNLELMSNFLNVTTFNNGDPIKYIEDPIEWELAIKNKVPAYCYYMNKLNSKWIIYNDIAQNDPRGIIPNGWRRITQADIFHLTYTLGFEFDIRSQFVYGEDYPGFRAQTGEFTTGGPGNMYRPDQYVICVKDAQHTKNNNKTEYNNTLFMGELFQPKDPISNFNNDSFYENISKSRINKIDWKSTSVYDLPDEKSYVTEYSKYYNISGVEVIKTLVENNFAYLFRVNQKFKIVGISELLFCKDGKYERFSPYNEVILGLILKPNKNKNEMICTYMYKNCGFYANNEEKNNGLVTSSTFYRSGDFTYTNGKGINLTFHFFPHMNCYQLNNPLENLVIEFDNCFGKNENWLSTEYFNDPYGDIRQDVIPHIGKINQFFDNY